MQKKNFAVAGAIAVMSLTIAFNRFAGEWKQDDGGWWWQDDNGSYKCLEGD